MVKGDNNYGQINYLENYDYFEILCLGFLFVCFSFRMHNAFNICSPTASILNDKCFSPLQTRFAVQPRPVNVSMTVNHND